MSLKCTYTHNHLAIVTATGHVTPCCQYVDSRLNHEWDYTKDLDSLDGLLESDHWKQIRADLAAGKKLNGCKNCWKAEHGEMTSKRQYSNEIYPEHKTGVIEDLEIGLDFTCNMMCRICKPEQSSKWNAADPELVAKLRGMRGRHYSFDGSVNEHQKDMKRVIDNTDLQHLRSIRVVGGEPFYSKNFPWLIDKLATETNLSELEFAVNTNGSIIPKPEQLNHLCNMKKTMIDISIDAVGDLASCIRWGVNWNIIYENLKIWAQIAKENPSVKVNIHTTMSILNINKIQEIIDLTDELGLYFSHHQLYSPDFFHHGQIPLEYRDKWQISSQRMSDFQINDINSMITTNFPVENKLYDFEKAIEWIDNYQGMKFEEHNPEIWELAQEVKNYF